MFNQNGIVMNIVRLVARLRDTEKENEKLKSENSRMRMENSGLKEMLEKRSLDVVA